MYIASSPESYAGQVVGSGQCVAYVEAAAGAPLTSQWTQGAVVRGADLPSGTAIATFVNGSYPNAATGNHAAIYLSQDADGLNVWDQWVGQPVHQRKIHFRGGVGSPSNDGDAFSVIEGP
jgi:hypothetical protein